MLSPSRHCIAPHCPAPYPQPEHHRFCQQCGSPLVLQGRYIPRSRLGEGGFAQIYTVWDAQTQQERVLKVLTYEDSKNEVALKLFRQEAQVLQQLHHPGIPQVEPESYFKLTTPQQQTLHCLVMEKIQGDNLEVLLERDYPQGCPEDLIRTWLWQVTEILKLLHQRGIIHRDIKPANLMRRADTGQIVLIDFGGAKQFDPNAQATRSTQLFSGGYSPPEQMVGQAIDPRVDLYALGRTLIHLLTGRYPGDLSETPQGELVWQRPDLHVSNTLAQLLNQMIALDVRDRPPTAAAVQHRLSDAPTVPLPPIPQPLQPLKTWFEGHCPPQIRHKLYNTIQIAWQQGHKLRSELEHHYLPELQAQRQQLQQWGSQVTQQYHHQAQRLKVQGSSAHQKLTQQATQWWQTRPTVQRPTLQYQLTPKLTALKTTMRQQRRQIRQQTGQLLRRGSRYTLTSLRTTTTQMLASSTGAIVGTLIGWGIHTSTWGRHLILEMFNPALTQVLPGVGLALSPEIWLITLAGMGTAVGLAAQSGHLTQRPVPIIGLLGGISHTIAWLVWRYCPGGIAVRLLVWIALAVGGMVLSLGLKRSHLTPYLGLTILGTASMIWSALTASQYWLQVGAMLSLQDGVLTYGLCAVLALVLGFWLGLTHHVLLPMAQWLRNRLTPRP